MNYNIPIEKTGLAEEKQAFNVEKTGLQEEKQAFETRIAGLDVTAPTKGNIMKIYQKFGDNIVFSRADVMKVTGLTATPATELMRKLRNNGLIESAAGRGKYRFSETQD